MIQTKRDTLVLQVGGWAWGWEPHPVKIIFVEMPFTFLSKSSPDRKPHPSVKGPGNGASLPCSPKWCPYGNIQNEIPLLGMGDIEVKDVIPNFYFEHQLDITATKHVSYCIHPMAPQPTVQPWPPNCYCTCQKLKRRKYSLEVNGPLLKTRHCISTMIFNYKYAIFMYSTSQQVWHITMI